MPPFDGAECQLSYAALRPSTGPGASCTVSPFGALPWARPRDPAAPRGKILGFGGPGAFPGGPNWFRGNCAAHLRGPDAASNLQRHAPCAL